MNLKIENKYLDITNYPAVEKYLEYMASQGWLISKMFLQNLFVFKKIEPQELDFSISPYEIETDFTKKTKEEIKEFEGICESVGWNYITRSYNLYVYYKDKNSDALDIHTDEEVELEILKSIGKTQIRNNFIQILLSSCLAWMFLKKVTTNVYGMKNMITQILIPLTLLTVTGNIINLVSLKKFLKTNTENIELGKELEYDEGEFYFARVNFALGYLVIGALIIYSLYMYIFLKNKIIISGFLLALMIAMGAILFDPLIKTMKKSRKYKTVALGATLLGVGIISAGILNVVFGDSDNIASDDQALNRNEYKVILISDFTDTSGDSVGTMVENMSILIPKSYEYRSEELGKYETNLIETEYSRALTSGVAQKLVEAYKSQWPSVITKTDHTLWNLDEAYFLRENKDEIVLRKGKEVFVLRGIDFTDPEVVEVAKEKLAL